MPTYADQAVFAKLHIIDNYALAKDTMCIRIEAPQQLHSCKPGQFFMLRDLRSTDPLIGRAFALYDRDLSLGWIELAYLVKGKLTRSVSQLKAGDTVGLGGPLGNCFDDSPVEHLVMVAGGVGQTPFLCLAKEALGKERFGDRRNGYAKQVSLCYGARSRDYLAGVSSFQQVGVDVHIATEDGSVGSPRRVTSALEELLQDANLNSMRIACCGPEPMMQAVSQIAKARGIRCQVSLETPMACGVGICFTCVAKVGTDGDWDYQRTCIEGPIFEANQLVW